MAFVVVTSLLSIVDQHLLQSNNQSVKNILDDDTEIIPILSKKLGFIQIFLEKLGIETTNRTLEKEIKDVAVEAEAKIESKLREIYLASTHEDCCELLQILKQVDKDIESLVVKIQKENKSCSTKDALKLENIVAQSSTKRDSGHDNEMVGCEDEIEKIKNMVIDPRFEQLEVISITGMGGIGKTTLAKRVYDDSLAMSHFEVRAWAVVSQEYDVKRILISLLTCIVSSTEEIIGKEKDQLAEQLRKHLLGRRYLIVIDDIWSTEAWDDIKRCFPDNFSGSRILMTTRQIEVATYASSSKYINSMRFLKTTESWNLFKREVIGGKQLDTYIPGELKSIGKDIVEKCQGLPLAIVVIAGLLAALDKTPQAWNGVAENMKSLDTIDTSKKCIEILSLSYNYLPSHLKACFLYFGVFPEDRDILVNKLIGLWVAEGLLMKKMMNNTLEQVAEDYLYNLINRNLVQVSKRSSDGKIKWCKLHDMLHDLSVTEAKSEKFLSVGKQLQSANTRWVSCKSSHLPTSDVVRSILYVGEEVYLSKRELVFSCLKLMRVLDLSLIKCWHGLPSEIVGLVCLRYLALATVGSLDQFQLFKLQNLQTLIVCSWKEECRLRLPRHILDLPQLRHAQIDKLTTLYLPNKVQENVQTLFWLNAIGNDSRTTNFEMVPNLKELGVYIDNQLPPSALDSLDKLHLLEKLKFEMKNVERFYFPRALPENIKKLTLRCTYLPWKDMDIIGRCRQLEVLRLKDFAFYGTEWEPEDDGFKRLRLLLIAHSNLKCWSATNDHFPNLERLVLRFCWELHELPPDFSSSTTFRLIELDSCYPSLLQSARNIKEDIDGLCGDGTFVIRDLGAKVGLPEKKNLSSTK